MEIKLKKYKEQLKDWPEKGHHIMAQYDEEKIIVYQSYRKEIVHLRLKINILAEHSVWKE